MSQGKRLIAFDPKVSWGHIFTICTLMIGMVAGYYQLKADTQKNRSVFDREIAQVRAEIEVAQLQTLILINKNSDEINNQGKIISIRLENIDRMIRDMRAEFKADNETGKASK